MMDSSTARELVGANQPCTQCTVNQAEVEKQLADLPAMGEDRIRATVAKLDKASEADLHRTYGHQAATISEIRRRLHEMGY